MRSLFLTWTLLSMAGFAFGLNLAAWSLPVGTGALMTFGVLLAGGMIGIALANAAMFGGAAIVIGVGISVYLLYKHLHQKDSLPNQSMTKITTYSTQMINDRICTAVNGNPATPSPPMSSIGIPSEVQIGVPVYPEAERQINLVPTYQVSILSRIANTFMSIFTRKVVPSNPSVPLEYHHQPVHSVLPNSR